MELKTDAIPRGDGIWGFEFCRVQTPPHGVNAHIGAMKAMNVMRRLSRVAGLFADYQYKYDRVSIVVNDSEAFCEIQKRLEQCYLKIEVTIILINFSILVVSLLTIATAPNIYIILLASLLTGICSVMPQIFVPIAAQFSTPETKGKNVGMIISGLLTGILASRVVSGIAGEYMGWRFIFYVAAVLMVVCVIIIMRILPDIPSNFRGKYSDLMKSLLSLVTDYPQLRISSLRAGIAFGSFLALWSSLAFKMEQAPFFAGNNVIGLLGLCGIMGALTASFIGRYVHILGVKRLNYIGCSLLFIAWLSLYIGQNSYAGIISGILLIDIGMQCIQLSNQTTIFALNPKASNRINTIFMTTYFAGGSLGTFLAGTFWHWFGWSGVVGTGIALTACSLVINIRAKK